MLDLTFEQVTPATAEEVCAFESGQTKRNTYDAPGLARFLRRDGLGVAARLRRSVFRPPPLVGLLLTEGDTAWREMHVRALLVSRGFRRRGVASAMLGRLAAQATAAGWSCRADVGEAELPAQLLFRKCGWRCVGIAGEMYRFCYPEGDAAACRKRAAG